MKMHRRTLIAGTILLAAGSLAYAQGKEIPVGVFNSLTGTYAFGGVPIQNGMKLALEEANAAGLPGGNKFKVIEGDEAGDKGQAINLVNQFVRRDNVMLILGPTISSVALGAAPGTVAGMIVRQGGVVALVGIVVGLATALAGSRLIASLLYGVSARDPGVFAAATVTLLSVALVACWLPARRAASVDPLVALRAE